MKLLKEYYQLKPSPEMLKEYKQNLEEGKPLILVGKIQQGNKPNDNKRIYPKEILAKKIEKYIENFVRDNVALGELDHDDRAIVELKNVSHVMKEIWWDGDDVLGKIELLPTPSGKIAATLVAAGIPLGISSRAVGSVSHNESQGIDVVGEDLELVCWDLVSSPSSQKAYMRLSEAKELGDLDVNNLYPPAMRIRATLAEILKK